MLRTKETAHSAARARISAQETTPGQQYSTATLMSSTTLKPLKELTFGIASFSLFIFVVALLSNNIDASHP